MSGMVISVDMIYGDTVEDSAILTKVVDADKRDITELYRQFCRTNGFDVGRKSGIENAAIPFIKQYEALLP